ncbi:MAG TPA: hypothetical protein PKA87_14930 [Microthrixaceae bacterium]|nr:hypothetical protein [Microthrixaceae bacterium]HMX08827.1 hypothetical protein [Microthrixaceae bacterium]HMX66910.1 hypothetical protein [Microthrixaceae bacterium]HMY88983.1 hypothetical protein [Microthrixaceae bacterium]HNA36790.1 hypothetical protein [Microthrixaceae bacterium]
MDDHLGTVGADENDDLQQIAGSVGPEHEPPVRVLPDVLDSQGVLERMEHLVVSDAVTSGCSVDLHTGLLYYVIAKVGV